MSTMKEIIQRVDSLRPNGIEPNVKLRWISQLDGKIAADIMLMDISELGQFAYSYPENLESVPLVKFPHDDMYEYWLEAKIDAENGEYNRYQNSMALFNESYTNFLRWFASKYEPAQGPYDTESVRPGAVNYYISAYGLAVSLGYQGTVKEWIASLKGEKGDPGGPKGDKGDKGDPGYTPVREVDYWTEKDRNEIKEYVNGKCKGKAGFIYPLASGVVPEGFLLCDGAEYPREEYPELFAAIGTTYGEGDGETTFNVPNLQTRVPVGAGDGYALGQTGGKETHTLTVDEMPKHYHGSIGVLSANYDAWEETTLTGNTITHDSYIHAGTTIKTNIAENGNTTWTGGDQPHNIMQPYTVVNYIISTGKATEFVVGGGGGGDSAIHVIVDYNETGDLMANYSPAEIYQRLQADGNSCSVYLHHGDVVHLLTAISEYEARFKSIEYLEEGAAGENYFLQVSYTINSDRSVRIEERDIQLGSGGGSVSLDTTLTKEGMAADAKAVGDRIGDIETALDELHVYAQALIGGSAV